MKKLRASTLETIGLGSVLDIFRNQTLPIKTEPLISELFGKDGSIVISGGSGIVGAGKTIQLASRLYKYGIPIIALDFPGAQDNLTPHLKGLTESFGKEKALQISQNIIRMNYDGKTLPPALHNFNPKFLLEAIPEILEVKKTHYNIFRDIPKIEIRSVTSGFPSSVLGVGILHPAFPHHINKVWEVVEREPSKITHLLWSIGLIPIAVTDEWSFVLDVLFCGLLLSLLRYHAKTNMPYWKIDKLCRKHLGPNPFRAHDVIGSKGANFLSWSCLHHLSEKYGKLFEPTLDLIERKDTGEPWYPLNHFRPIVNWQIDTDEEIKFEILALGSMIQMTSIMLHENRAHFSSMNAIGELCAQFRNGILAKIRRIGRDRGQYLVHEFHKLYPEAKMSPWYPETLEYINSREWQQLYVNAEHDSEVGVISISRESYNDDVDIELNRAIDWLRKEGVQRVILTSDFHLSTQMVGADTSEFFGAINDRNVGYRISSSWSKTARKLQEFDVSIGVIVGKRCWGGFLELMSHCHYLLAEENSLIGMPEVTLPVVPGMEGCHWFFRKASRKEWSNVLDLLLEGRPLAAKNANWIIDSTGSIDDVLREAWSIASNGEKSKIKKIEKNPIQINESKNRIVVSEAQKAILECIEASSASSIEDALKIQASHAADFMQTEAFRKGVIGNEYMKIISG